MRSVRGTWFLACALEAAALAAAAGGACHEPTSRSAPRLLTDEEIEAHRQDLVVSRPLAGRARTTLAQAKSRAF